MLEREVDPPSTRARHRAGQEHLCTDGEPGAGTVIHSESALRRRHARGCVSRSFTCRTQKVKCSAGCPCVPTGSADQVNRLICLRAACQSLMALDKQPVQSLVSSPSGGCRRCRRAGPAWSRGAGVLLLGNVPGNMSASQGFRSRSHAGPLGQGDRLCYTAQRSGDGLLSPAHNLGNQLKNRD